MQVAQRYTSSPRNPQGSTVTHNHEHCHFWSWVGGAGSSTVLMLLVIEMQGQRHLFSRVSAFLLSLKRQDFNHQYLVASKNRHRNKITS